MLFFVSLVTSWFRHLTLLVPKRWKRWKFYHIKSKTNKKELVLWWAKLYSKPRDDWWDFLEPRKRTDALLTSPLPTQNCYCIACVVYVSLSFITHRYCVLSAFPVEKMNNEISNMKLKQMQKIAGLLLLFYSKMTGSFTVALVKIVLSEWWQCE